MYMHAHDKVKININLNFKNPEKIFYIIYEWRLI